MAKFACMNEQNLIFFIYGLCTMFYGMMVWFFLRKGPDRLSRLVALMMGVVCAQCVKDMVFYDYGVVQGGLSWMIMTAWNMTVVPIYAAILVELCKPGMLSWRAFCVHELFFILSAALLGCTGEKLWYDVETVGCAIYGSYWFVWTIFAIPRYNKALKEQFSYDDNINLDWLRKILYAFFFILTLWIVGCVYGVTLFDCLHLVMSMVVWMIICYFIYQHESVVKELRKPHDDMTVMAGDETVEEAASDTVGAKINELFAVDRIYLNPRLKLSDIVRMAGSNRTYVSQWFNRDPQSSFYDYVNNLRVEHACSLLRNTADSLAMIAEESGFNSLSTFHRVFSSKKGMTPSEYRSREGGA